MQSIVQILQIADLKQSSIDELQKGGKLIFIRHAYAPGSGDPDNFDINNCSTQRNLSDNGRIQALKIGDFFKLKKILTLKHGYPQFYTQILFEKDKPEIFVKAVLNDVESLSKISSCKKIEKFDQES